MEAIEKKQIFSITSFVISVLIVCSITGFYFYNIVKWVNYPNFGFGYRTATGISTVGVLTEIGFFPKDGLEGLDGIFGLRFKGRSPNKYYGGYR